MLNQHKLEEYGDILSAKDVKEILGIGCNKVYELLTSGAIKNFKIGRVRKIPKGCLIDYIREMSGGACCNTYFIKGDDKYDSEFKN